MTKDRYLQLCSIFGSIFPEVINAHPELPARELAERAWDLAEGSLDILKEKVLQVEIAAAEKRTASGGRLD